MNTGKHRDHEAYQTKRKSPSQLARDRARLRGYQQRCQAKSVSTDCNGAQTVEHVNPTRVSSPTQNNVQDNSVPTESPEIISQLCPSLDRSSVKGSRIKTVLQVSKHQQPIGPRTQPSNRSSSLSDKTQCHIQTRAMKRNSVPRIIAKDNDCVPVPTFDFCDNCSYDIDRLLLDVKRRDSDLSFPLTSHGFITWFCSSCNYAKAEFTDTAVIKQLI